MSKAYTYKCGHIAHSIITPCRIGRPFSTENASAEVNALWDTGATCTCISEDLANAIGLLPDDETELTVGDNRKVKSRVYSVQLNMGDFVVPYIRVNSLPPNRTHDVIIGMDIISMGDLTISNYSGQTTLSFRFPSICEKDYRHELDRYQKIHAAWIKTGNNKCPCGSHKLWENCHGKE